MAEIKRVSSSSLRIKEAMLLAGKTQADLVRETGLNKSTISRYLSGECEPKQIAIGKLAFSLHVDEMWLWGYDVPMKKTTVQSDSGMSETKQQLLALAESCSEEEASKLLQMMELFLGRK